jgi:hypothetical protein
MTAVVGVKRAASPLEEPDLLSFKERGREVRSFDGGSGADLLETTSSCFGEARRSNDG